MKKNKVKILELIQWIKPRDLLNFNLTTYRPRRYRGHPDSPRRFRSIHYHVSHGDACVKKVSEDWSPTMGYIWYRQGPNDQLVAWKQNIDSSG